MWQTRRFALFAMAFLLASGMVRQVSARSNGAPVAACGDLTQQHFTSPASCGRDCPFSVSLVAVDGTPVAAGAAQTYKCGSEHTREQKLHCSINAHTLFYVDADCAGITTKLTLHQKIISVISFYTSEYSYMNSWKGLVNFLPVAMVYVHVTNDAACRY